VLQIGTATSLRLTLRNARVEIPWDTVANTHGEEGEHNGRAGDRL
jgi:hypothetical protein